MVKGVANVQLDPEGWAGRVSTASVISSFWFANCGGAFKAHVQSSLFVESMPQQ